MSDVWLLKKMKEDSEAQKNLLQEISGMKDLDDLENVNIASPVDGEVLTFDGSAWNNEVVPTAQCFDRGDMSEHDFSKEDFITDANWHDLDLSNKIPQGTSVVQLHCRASCATEGAAIQFRKKGNTNTINVSVLKIVDANEYIYPDFWVACSSDRKIQYLSSNVTWAELSIEVVKWIK